MALATTTLASAVLVSDTSIVVASATSLAPGRLLIVDQELMRVTAGYVNASTTVPVLRGQDGTAAKAHVITANVTHGLSSDWSGPGDGTFTSYQPAGRSRHIVSITATTATLTLAPAGTDLMVILNGTAAITLTVPVPTKEMDGNVLWIVSNGVAAHVPTFTGGLGGVGSGYTTLTAATGANICLLAIACDGAWNIPSAPAWTSTVTKVTAAIG